MTRRWIFAAWAVLLAGVPAFAQDGVILRTQTDPETAWVGQRARFVIEVLGADGWAQITEMGSMEIPGAYDMQTESQGVRLNEMIGRTSYTGQRYQLSIYCQRPGRLQIPPLPVTVVVKQWGLNADETPQELMTPATSLECRVPPGAEGIRSLISTTRLDAEQSWSTRPDTAAPGDAVTRTVTLSAADVTGMAFPPMRHPEIEGVAVYPGQPSVSDETNRGALDGRREESVTYVFESPGTIALPDLVLSWWDLENEQLRRIELPGLEITVEGGVAPEPVAEPVAAPEEPPPNRALTFVIAVAVGAAILLLLIGIGRWLARRRQEWLESEAAAFNRVKKTLRAQNPAAISAAIMHWLDRLDPGPRPARLDLFLEGFGDDNARAAAAALAQSLVTGGRFEGAKVLARGLANARRKFRRTRQAVERADRILPELNGFLPSQALKSEDGPKPTLPAARGGRANQNPKEKATP